jgi:hypothetical protein
MEITPGNIAAMRLVAQQLVSSDAQSPGDVARNLLAMQAQDFAASLWALGVRLPGCTIDDVYAAIDRGEIVRSWPMRGTLHFVAAEDLRWILDVTAERTIRSVGARQERLGLPDKALVRATKIAYELLGGGGRSTRAEFVKALSDGGVNTDGQLGYHIIWYLAHAGEVCWGPMVGTQQALVLSNEWLPPSTSLDRDSALGQFLYRYLAGHGPATLKDFAWWNKVLASDAKRALEAVRDGLTELTMGGSSYWITMETFDFVQSHLDAAKKSVLLLPSFDEHLLGYQDRSLVMSKDEAARVVPGNNGMFLPTVVIDGRVAGTWKRMGSKTKPAFESVPFATFSEAQQKGIRKAVRSYEAFLGRDFRIDS